MSEQETQSSYAGSKRSDLSASRYHPRLAAKPLTGFHGNPSAGMLSYSKLNNASLARIMHRGRLGLYTGPKTREWDMNKGGHCPEDPSKNKSQNDHSILWINFRRRPPTVPSLPSPTAPSPPPRTLRNQTSQPKSADSGSSKLKALIPTGSRHNDLFTTTPTQRSGANLNQTGRTSTDFIRPHGGHGLKSMD